MLPNCELIKVGGTQFLVFKGQDLISNHLKRELYEDDLHQLCLKLLINEPEGVVLDIGANLGTFCLPLAKKITKHTYHAFEPQRIVYYQLCGNAFINGLDNVHCHNTATTLAYLMRESALSYRCLTTLVRPTSGLSALTKKFVRMNTSALLLARLSH